MAWDEIFSSKIDSGDIQHAEKLLSYSMNHVNGLEYSLHLFESITQWAQKNNIEIGQRFRWLVDELADLRTNRILVTGTSGNGKNYIYQLYIRRKYIRKINFECSSFKK